MHAAFRWMLALLPAVNGSIMWLTNGNGTKRCNRRGNCVAEATFAATAGSLGSVADLEQVVKHTYVTLDATMSPSATKKTAAENMTLAMKFAGEEGASLTAPISFQPPFDLTLVTNLGVHGDTLHDMTNAFASSDFQELEETARLHCKEEHRITMKLRQQNAIPKVGT